MNLVYILYYLGNTKKAGPTCLWMTPHALCDFNVQIGVLKLKSASIF
jgi:hypothetical protein